MREIKGTTSSVSVPICLHHPASSLQDIIFTQRPLSVTLPPFNTTTTQDVCSRSRQHPFHPGLHAQGRRCHGRARVVPDLQDPRSDLLHRLRQERIQGQCRCHALRPGPFLQGRVQPRLHRQDPRRHQERRQLHRDHQRSLSVRPEEQGGREALGGSPRQGQQDVPASLHDDHCARKCRRMGQDAGQLVRCRRPRLPGLRPRQALRRRLSSHFLSAL